MSHERGGPLCPSVGDIGCAFNGGIYNNAADKIYNAAQGLGLSHVAAELLSGSLAGVGCIISGFPFDTVKTRLQTSPPGTYRGMAHCGVEIVKKHGVSARRAEGVPPPVQQQLQALAQGCSNLISQSVKPRRQIKNFASHCWSGCASPCTLYVSKETFLSHPCAVSRR